MEIVEPSMSVPGDAATLVADGAVVEPSFVPNAETGVSEVGELTIPDLGPAGPISGGEEVTDEMVAPEVLDPLEHMEADVTVEGPSIDPSAV